MEFKRIRSENLVRDYFLRSRNGERAKCETWEKTISCKGGSTEQRWKPVGSTGTGRVAGRVEILRPAGWKTGQILLSGN